MGSVARGDEPILVGEDQHLLSHLWDRRADIDDRVVLSRPPDWTPMTRAELCEQVRFIAAGLVAAGLERGDRVAIMSPTRVEWTIADLAILAAGCVTVPIYDTSSVEQCRSILIDSRARYAFAADETTAQTLRDASGSDGTLDHIAVFDDSGLEGLVRSGEAAHRDDVDRRVEALRGGDVASIVYTSGTTGEPKGCVITHRNLLWTARQTLHRLEGVIDENDSTLLFLPMAHIFTRLVQYVCLEADVNVGFARSLDDLPNDLASFRPTFLLAVPRVFEKVFRSAQRRATGARSKVFDFAVTSGEQWSRADEPGLLLRLRHSVSDRLVYGKLREAVGGRVRFCVSGGAALNPKLGHFFHAAGITILEGYGLTETSAPATVNTPTEIRIGTVGRPIPGVEIRIDRDALGESDDDAEGRYESLEDDVGEILIRGESVFAGYHHNEQATTETMDDGWLRTGDLGKIDDDGYVMITDRRKEMIVTANGKNVAPGPIEERIAEHRLVSKAMVVGDGRPFLAALVTLDPDELADFARSNHLPGDAPEALRSNDAVRAQIDEAIESVNQRVSRSEWVRQFQILPREFSQEDDELTPTMKLRRRDIAEHFADEIEAIYSDRG